MFGLPLSTSLMVFGIPALWIVYTVVFLWLSRGWKAEEKS